MAKEKELKVTTVTFEQFSGINFIPPANFYVRDAMNVYHFISTSDRLVAQRWIDDTFGPNKYNAVPSKVMKTKSKLESGGLSCTGTESRRK